LLYQTSRAADAVIRSTRRTTETQHSQIFRSLRHRPQATCRSSSKPTAGRPNWSSDWSGSWRRREAPRASGCTVGSGRQPPCDSRASAGVLPGHEPRLTGCLF